VAPKKVMTSGLPVFGGSIAAVPQDAPGKPAIRSHDLITASGWVPATPYPAPEQAVKPASSGVQALSWPLRNWQVPVLHVRGLLRPVVTTSHALTGETSWPVWVLTQTPSLPQKPQGSPAWHGLVTPPANCARQLGLLRSRMKSRTANGR